MRPIQLEGWRLLWQEYVSDSGAQAHRRQWDAQRRRMRPAATSLLRRFLTGEIDVRALRSAFDRQARTDWSGFGAQGTAAMFLNALVKYAPDITRLDALLRDLLPVPADAEVARARLAVFSAYLSQTRSAGAAGSSRILHRSHAVFFASMWWHLQAPDRWPAFHTATRRALETEEELYRPLPSPIADYFAFRDAFLLLRRALSANAWAVEHLCWWHEHRVPAGDDSPYERVARRARRRRTPADVGKAVSTALVVREPAPATDVGEAGEATGAATGERHTYVQWLLADLGRRVGCRIWVAANDHARIWRNETLGSLSIDRLPPLGLDPEAERLVALIDVVWLDRGNQVVAAFEVERTTSVHSGLLRMSDLTALSPNLSFPLYIVAPRARLERVRRELSRPTFQRIALHRRSGFFAEEDLVDAAAGIARWSGGPAAIARLAEWVGDVRRAD
jgi:hypothetical protein